MTHVCRNVSEPHADEGCSWVLTMTFLKPADTHEPTKGKWALREGDPVTEVFYTVIAHIHVL